jgi:transcriptional regulator with XRE-family HTH domain
MTPPVDAETLGQRIRDLRSNMRMTLKQVEQQSGLSATHLSEIERGRTSPTIGALVRIARAMGKDASFFLETDERADVGLLLRDEVQALGSFAGAKVEALTPGIPGGALCAYRMQLPPGGETFVLGSRHALTRDVILTLRSGRVAVDVRCAQVVLEAGDTLQATLGDAIRIQAQGDATADLHMVTSEPLEAQS